MSAGATRTAHAVGHVTFELGDHPEFGRTFALMAGQAADGSARRKLFTGPIEPGMAAQLRALADAVEGLE